MASSQKIVFAGLTAGSSDTLWVTDGTSGGTVNITPAGVLFFNAASLLEQVGTHVIFMASYFQGGKTAASALWTTDGTQAGTQPIGSVKYNYGFVSFGSFALFNGSDATGRSGIWSTDGTAAGTHFVTATTSIGIARPQEGEGAALGPNKAIFVDPIVNFNNNRPVAKIA